MRSPDKSRPKQKQPDGPPIFCIGMNKCGTTSLHEMFRASGLRSVSSGHAKMRPAAQTMFNNLSACRPLLTGLERFRAFSDINFLSPRVYLDAHVLFARLDRENPGAYFILNTRPKADWLRSRAEHVSPRGRSFAERFAKAFEVKPEEVEAIWSEQWDRHHAAVREHFAGRDERFLEFDISSDDPERLATFLAPYRLSTDRWGVHNATDARPAKGARPARRGGDKKGRKGPRKGKRAPGQGRG